jgi:hypothetical protein
MQIISSSLALASSRQFMRTEVEVQRLSVGAAVAAATPRVAPSAETRAVTPPPAAPRAEPGVAARDGADGIQAASEAASRDPQLRLLVRLIEALTGRSLSSLRVSDAAAEEGKASRRAAPPPQANRGGELSMRVERQFILQESETTQVVAEGRVLTADGREISFRIALQMSRQYLEVSSQSLQLDAAQRKDPLVLNFAGTAAQLGDQRFEFDLDADGSTESLPVLLRGSGFLVFDRNGNGLADDGSELFGAQSGNGFAELALLDEDGNGWLDAGDSAFADLRIGFVGAQGIERLRSLEQLGVAAIGLAHVDSRFDLRGARNSDLGQVRASGVYLREDGRAGLAQQIDLSV